MINSQREQSESGGDVLFGVRAREWVGITTKDFSTIRHHQSWSEHSWPPREKPQSRAIRIEIHHAITNSNVTNQNKSQQLDTVPDKTRRGIGSKRSHRYQPVKKLQSNLSIRAHSAL